MKLMERYNDEVKVSTIFFDLDDTLYPATSGLWPLIRDRIGLYMQEKMHIPKNMIPGLRQRLFEEYGTTLRGLQATYDVDVAEFLAFVHDVPLAEYIQPDPSLSVALSKLPVKKYIFTNADVPHARRVLEVLELEKYFDGIIDVVALNPYCKPMAQSFDIALMLAGKPDPGTCVMIDDIARTTRAARTKGIFSILFGAKNSSPDADVTLSDWSQLPNILESI